MSGRWRDRRHEARQSDGTVDVTASKAVARAGVWVQIPGLALTTQHGFSGKPRKVPTVALQTAAQHVTQAQPGPRCGFGAIVKSLPADDKDYLDQMIEEGRTRTFIAEVFRTDGYEVSDYNVNRHLNGKCSCR